MESNTNNNNKENNLKEIIANYLCCLGSRKKDDKNKEQIELNNQPTITNEENQITIEESEINNSFIKNKDENTSNLNSTNRTKTQVKTDDKTRAIFLIGSTGKGKSTLANVLINKDNEFEEIFKESGASISGTREVQKEEFIENGINYAIIDTVGLGDTQLKKEEVLDKIAEAVYLAKDGISQILFVIDDKFNPHEMVNYDLLKTIIFDNEVANHTTIVRTRFEDFKQSEKCQEDINLMIEEGGKLAEIINSCQKKVVYVDNPSLNLTSAKRKKEIPNRKETRSASRKLLLEHLKKNCQETSYKPEKLKKLSGEIAEDMDNLIRSRKKLEKEMKELKISKSTSIDNQFSKIDELNEDYYYDSDSSSLRFDFTHQTHLESAIGDKVNDVAIGKIIQLQDKKERLKREIVEKEKVIRQKVLKHIFNNYGDISNEVGGDIFMDSVIGDHNWKDVHFEFSNKELVVRWLSQGFDYKQVQKWATALGNSFNPEHDAGFCAWLRDDRKLMAERIQELDYPYDIEQLRKEYAKQLEKEVVILDKHNQQLSQAETDELKEINTETVVEEEDDDYGSDSSSCKFDFTELNKNTKDEETAEISVPNDTKKRSNIPLVLGILFIGLVGINLILAVIIRKKVEKSNINRSLKV